jgi:hypothetical protein
MLKKAIATACALAFIAGCAGRSAGPELPADHPARPDAAAAPLPQRSSTLAAGPGAPAAPTSVATAPAAAATDGPAVYACPHHPEVTSDKPGQLCPKCGMLLGKKEAPPTQTSPTQASPTAEDPHAGHR